MQNLYKSSSVQRKSRLIAVLPIAAIALAGSLMPATAASDSPTFQRHFWRGQHGHGNIDFHGKSAAGGETGFAGAEALVEDGTQAAAIARRARR